MVKGNEILNEKTIYKNEKLSKYSWFNLGGPAEVLYKPNPNRGIEELLIKKKINNKNIFILGAGSNTLFRDTGFNGFIIKLGKQFTNIKLLEDNKIEVGAATLDKKISRFCLSKFNFRIRIFIMYPRKYWWCSHNE